MRHVEAAMRGLGWVRWGALLLAGSCAGPGGSTQGPTQPQATAGPCEVERFFLLGFRSVPTRLAVANTGEACRFTLINPALNVVVDAALLTGAPRNGVARVELIGGARQVAVSYTPARGYAGPDRFDITLEPGAVGVTFNVTVSGAR